MKRIKISNKPIKSFCGSKIVANARYANDLSFTNT